MLAKVFLNGTEVPIIPNRLVINNQETTMILPDLGTRYRQICSLILHDDEIKSVGFSGSLHGHAPDLAPACPDIYNIIKDGTVIEQFSLFQACRTRIRELAVPLDLVVKGAGKYWGKTIKELPTWLYDDLIGISTG